MTRRQIKATETFLQGYNCAQAVFLSFADDLSMDPGQITKIAAGFGGGMGRLQRTCGALTGAFMVLGSLINQPYLELEDKKNELIDRIQALVKEFEQEFGSSDCRDLIGVDLMTEEGRTEAENQNLSETRCKHYILKAVSLLEKYFPR
jgi:C_GCAxxG_C_C family probable redox protein